MRRVRVLGPCFAVAVAVISLASVTGCGGAKAAPAAGPSNSANSANSAAPGAPAAAAKDAAKAAPVVPAVEKPAAAAIETRVALAGGARSSFEGASRAFTEGRLPDAHAAFLKAASEAPRSSIPLVGVGAVLERQGDTAGAIEAYRRAVALEPGDADAARSLVMALVGDGKGEEAVSLARARAQSFTKSAAAATLHAEAASATGDSATAQAEAQRGLSLDSSYVPAMLAVARDHYRAGRVSMTAYALTALLDGINETTPPRAKDNAEALFLRAVIDRRTPGRRTAALEGFGKVYQLRPDLTEAALALGVMTLEAGNAEAAIGPLETASRFSPKNAYVATALGDAYRLAGRYAEAKSTLERAATLNAALREPHYNLAILFLYAGDKVGLGPEERYASALREMEAYVAIRGSKAPPGVDDDADSLMSTAKQKLAEAGTK